MDNSQKVFDCLEGVRQGKIEVQDVVVEPMSSIPEDSNPYHYDLFNMGRTQGSNLTLMFANHEEEICRYLILVHKDGRRWRIRIPD